VAVCTFLAGAAFALGADFAFGAVAEVFFFSAFTTAFAVFAATALPRAVVGFASDLCAAAVLLTATVGRTFGAEVFLVAVADFPYP
jgi:hypothetical protein